MSIKLAGLTTKECLPDGPCDQCGTMTVYVPVGGGNFCYACASSDLDNVEVCPAHNLVLGEGAPCAACEQAAHNQLCAEAFTYIDNVVRGRSINHISPSQRTPGQHIALLCIVLGAYGATTTHIIEVMRLRNIPGSTETVQAVLEYLK